MQDQRIARGEKAGRVRSPAEEDQMVQVALLHLLLEVYPAMLSNDEALREMTLDPKDFGEADELRRAIGELVRAGLLHQHGAFLLPTQAAVRCNRLFNP